ncbi:MAG TPA: tRNA (adenosine(37)-N6)-threonylcarbamoyltransferase complex ATPase subunit type 1 TsaE [Pyrinomonadaceae bacterium]|nr:tRNA (adenosine(37)-N6)-threonylcarbamoyltransferase complex ATPase subunit type 1 TsaE [Pyrinomonadaceae bacterium]
MMSAAEQNISSGEWISRDAGETFDLGRQIGAQLRGGEILMLDGPLGAGKTILVKGLAAGLNVDPDEVTSPSFTLVNPYNGRLSLFHIDLYRLDAGASAAHAVDLEELLTDERAVIVIEWAERLGKYPLPPCVWHVRVQGDGDAARTILISKPS